MNSNLVIIGTRDRPHNAKRAFEQLKKVSIESDYLMIINEDQQGLYSPSGDYSQDYENVKVEVVPSEFGCIGKANHVLAKYWNDYQTIAGIDDDCMVTTHGWDGLLSAPIKARGYGLSYGADGIQNENLPTKVMISTNILRELGWFAPPTIFHLYADNFWKNLGNALGALDYFPDVAMEHWHHLNGKAPKDALYESIYESSAVTRDRTAYDEYMATHFGEDVQRVQSVLNKGE